MLIPLMELDEHEGDDGGSDLAWPGPGLASGLINGQTIV